MGQIAIHRSPVALFSVPALCVAVAALRDDSRAVQANVVPPHD